MVLENKHTLIINKKFFDSLNKDQPSKILRIYGFEKPEKFIEFVISKLNKQYNFLNIQSYDFLTKEESSEYHMYNGYISGNFIDYDLITISFTTIEGKEGNVFLSQQVMPMITQKTNKDTSFLINNRVKKICLLTTHKSHQLTQSANEISDTGISNIQMNINYINTLGFDVVDILHIKNLNINAKYSSADELIDHTNYLQKKKPKNSQFKQITKKNYEYFASFEENPVGQEIKFFSLKLYAVIILLKGFNINISEALKQTDDITLKTMSIFITFLNSVNLSDYIIFDPNLNNEEDNEVPETITNMNKIKQKDEKDIPCYEKEPLISYNKKGRMTFNTQRIFKKESFELHKYECACHDSAHLYFISEATKEKYVEGHHMIPMEYQEKYWIDERKNLDCVINLIPLCPHCHSKIHKAIKGERIQIITAIFQKYKHQIETIDKYLTLDKFAELYNVYIY